jgi:cysteine sulfinate desulfinase/cysteine desulfurase-like protein
MYFGQSECPMTSRGQSLRLGVGRFTTANEIDRAAKLIIAE